MIVFAIIALLLFAMVAFVWHSKRQNAKMALFIEELAPGRIGSEADPSGSCAETISF